MKLDIGSGRSKLEGYTTVDNDPLVNADICCDITEHIPVANNSVEEIRCSHVLEHIDPTKKVKVMAELYRVLQMYGVIFISLPVAGSKESYMDPTHISFWNEESFWYFEKGNNFHEAFKKRYSQFPVPGFQILNSYIIDGWELKVTLKKV